MLRATELPVRLLLLLGLAAPLVGCPLDDDDAGDDDDITGDDDDITGDDDDTPPGPVAISGTVYAVDRDTGAPLDDDAFLERANGLIVYLLTDPNDWSAPLAKFTMATPGAWSTTLPADTGAIYALGLAATHGDRIVGSNDVVREHAMNPRVVGLADLSGLDITFDLAAPGGGGGGGGGGDGCCGDGGGDGACTTIAGDIALLGLADGEVAVTANSPDLSAGPWNWIITEAPGAFSICVGDDREHVALLGIHDTDGNGWFEPSDTIGQANINPIALGIGDLAGAQIEIPSAVPISVPTPNPYVTIGGSVTYAGYTGGNILVFASVGEIDVYTATLAAPGAFTLRAPANTQNVVVWAVADADANGLYDLDDDANGAAAPLNTGTAAISGVTVNLLDPLDNSISGVVYWNGPVAPGDSLGVALHATADAVGSPLFDLFLPGPNFPQAFSFTDLPAGTYYLNGFLDVGSDSKGVVGPGEPVGFYGPPIVLSGGSHPSGLSFTLAN